MMILNVTCNGPCGDATVLATVELPDTATVAQQAAATVGYLGENCLCGKVYRFLVARLGLQPGVIPTKAQWLALKASVGQ